MSAQPQPNTWYRIKSTKGTVLDDWGGKTGENSAALQLDDIPDSLNRRWQLIPVEPGWWRIKSTKGTVLDDWGGKTGENSAALQPDDTPNSPNRKWSFVPTGDGWFRIKSTKGTVLDDWAGKTGENSAALQHDDAPNSPNRKWMLVPVTQVPTTTTPTAHPKLALLADLVGEWQGPGMNTIAVPSPTGTLGIFKLMVHSTVEHMSFEAVEQVFNRGSKFDIELNGVKYLQKVTDTTNGAEIHLEPGFWLHVPQSAQDQESYVRLATVPHGDSLLAVSTQFSSSMGPPQFNAVSTIPFPLNSAIPDLFAPNTINTANPYFDPFTKPSQLPPGLTAEMVQNPVLNLQQHVAGQQILDTITFRITTNKPGGITNIPFVVREANAVLMDAVFWIETVRGADGKTFKQLQYVQRVVLDFPPDHWPHISVGTLRKVGQLE